VVGCINGDGYKRIVILIVKKAPDHFIRAQVQETKALVCRWKTKIQEVSIENKENLIL
jgi:hypothetical protein